MPDVTSPGEQAPGPSRRWRRGLALVLALVLVVLLPYLLVNDETHDMDGAARAGAPGTVVRLSAGDTYYELAGPAGGPMVVLVHGTTIPSLVWDHNIEALAAAGMRVVRYDLFGRGLSDRPRARYDLELYVRQLEELLAHVARGAPVDLVGLSLGGMIVAEFAQRHPDRVRKVALIDPAGVGTRLPLAARIAVAPGVGEYVMRVAGTRQLTPSRRNVLHPERHARLDSVYLRTIRFRGSRRAVLESIRTLPMAAYDSGYHRLGALGKPTLLVWGRHDAVVPFSNSERVRELVRPSRFVVVEDAGHLSNYERPDEVNAALVAFLRP
ncbi:MAG TPA: alpha/beta fold hydrolase [Gemmatimonadaceae bacterium]|nr:alpha/beta fold hydrolase [Gemmatimonadaceae bacterium]